MMFDTDSINLNYREDGKVFLSWQAVQGLCNRVGKEIEDLAEEGIRSKPKWVLALGRGAMCMAAMLAPEGTPVFYTGVRSYAGKEKGELDFYQPTMPHLDELFNQPSTLIVDDLWDSGQTFSYAQRRWPEAKTAALLSKKKEHSLDYVGLVLPTDAWIVFPWE